MAITLLKLHKHTSVTAASTHQPFPAVESLRSGIGVVQSLRDNSLPTLAEVFRHGFGVPMDYSG